MPNKFNILLKAFFNETCNQGLYFLHQHKFHMFPILSCGIKSMNESQNFITSRDTGQHCAMQGGRGWLAFVHRSRIPQSFRRMRICKFLGQKHCFLQLRGKKQFVVIKRPTHTQERSLKHPFRSLDRNFFFTKLSKRGLYKSSLKARFPNICH